MKNFQHSTELLQTLPPEIREAVEKFAHSEKHPLEEAIRQVLARGVAAIHGKPNNGSLSAEIAAQLSTRQNQILCKLRSGSAIKEIAGDLAISEATVRTHILRIRQRLECNDLLSLRMP